MTPTQPEAAVQPQPEIPDGLTWLIHQSLFLITPFFMDGAADDETCARAAAKELLASYGASSAEELQIVTECIIFAYAAMDTLRQAKADPDLTDDRRLRLRNNAAALSCASQRNRRGFDALRKLRTSAPEPRPDPPAPHPFVDQLDPAAVLRDLQEKIAEHRQRMAEKACAQGAHAPLPLPPASINPGHRDSAEPAPRQ